MYIYRAPNKIIMLCIIHIHNINFFYLENKSYRLRKQTVGSYIVAFKSTYLSIINLFAQHLSLCTIL